MNHIRFLVFLFFFSNVYAQTSFGLYQEIDAGLGGEVFFANEHQLSALDGSAQLQQDFYINTKGLFAKQYQNYQLSTISKTSAGNIFAGMGTLLLPNDQTYSFDLGFGKSFNPFISSGFVLRPLLHKKKSTLSINYSFRVNFVKKNYRKTFALHSLEMIFALHNIGVSWFHPQHKEDSALLGVQSKIIDHNHFSFLLLSHIGWRYLTKKVSWSLASSLQIYFMYLRLGFSQDSFYNKNIFSLGLGGVYSWQQNQFKINYAFWLNTKNKKEMYHGLSFSFALPIPDKKAPQIQLQAQEMISQKDLFWTIETKIKEKNLLSHWSLSIFNQKNEEVAFLEMDKRNITKTFHVAGYFQSFFSNKNRDQLPQKIRWFFLSPPYALSPQSYIPEQPHSALATSLPDGKYHYRFTAKDNRSNNSTIQTGSFYIDRTPAYIKQVASEDVFYFSNKNPFYVLNAKIEGNAKDILYVSVFNSLQEKVDSWTIPLSHYKNRISWNTQKFAQGMYQIILQTKDQAQNKDIAYSKNFYVFKNEKAMAGKINVSLTKSFKPPFIYYPQSLSSFELERWTFTIYSQKEKKIVYQKAGHQTLPAQLIWDGKDFSKKKVTQGKYQIVFKAYPMQQEQAQQIVFLSQLDSEPPQVKVNLKHKRIIPDQDKYKDYFKFHVQTKDASAIESYHLQIFEKNKNFAPVLAKEFKGKGKPPKEIIWDNQLPHGKQFLSFAQFQFRLLVRDQAGNKTIIENKNLRTQISGNHKNDVFTFHIPFEFSNKNRLTRRLQRNLEVAYQYILRYPNYHIKIEANSWEKDQESFFQDVVRHEEKGLQKSEQIAQQVLRFFIRRGVEPWRLSFAGLGESQPLYPNQHDKDYGNYQNQRITIVLYRTTNKK